MQQGVGDSLHVHVQCMHNNHSVFSRRVTTIPIMILVSRVHLFFYLICINLVTFATKGTVFYFLILSTIYLDRKFRTVTNPQFKALQDKISMQRAIFRMQVVKPT